VLGSLFVLQMDKTNSHHLETRAAAAKITTALMTVGAAAVAVKQATPVS
jgi:hypothetical protein